MNEVKRKCEKLTFLMAIRACSGTEDVFKSIHLAVEGTGWILQGEGREWGDERSPIRGQRETWAISVSSSVV